MTSKIIYSVLIAAVVLIAGFYLFNNYIYNEKQADSDQSATTTVMLYYYNSANDMDETGNIMCTRDGLVPVERTVSTEADVIENTLSLLLEGEITAGEQAEGVTSEYPLDGVEISDTTLTEDGVLSIDISDPQNQTSGGSCRAGILSMQIEATAMQFEQVNAVVYTSPEVFQP